MSALETPTAKDGFVDSSGALGADVAHAGDRTIASKWYRYPGSPPFRDLELDRRLFKGREEEARQVFHSILSSGLFLLYAASGMGKSSLLSAGVMHRLRDRGCWPVVIRLNDTRHTPVEAIEQQISDAAQRDHGIDLVRTPGITIEPSPTLTLWDLLGSLEAWRDDRLQQLVVIFDQFEELFTLDWDDEVRERFIVELGEVMRGDRSTIESLDVGGARPAVPAPKIKFVLVVREDALGALEALAADVPSLMQHRFRLGPLDVSQAEAAIREPALVTHEDLDTQPFGYSDEAADEILRFLQDIEGSASPFPVSGRSNVFIDPSQLQIICQYIERRVLPNKRDVPPGEVIQIVPSDLGGPAGLRSILGDFYRRTIGSLPEPMQRSVRRLCEQGFISPSGRRLSLERGAIGDTFSVPLDVLDDLVDQRLLRAEPRVGSVYYELAHDTLVEPILAERAVRAERTSRRRRQIALAGVVVAIIVLAAIGGLALWRRSNDGAAPTRPLRFGASAQGSIAEPGQIAEFTVSGGAGSSLILVRSSGDGALNAAVELRNAAGSRRTQDQFGDGRAEHVVVPSGQSDGLEVAVTSNDQSTGRFEIAISELGVSSLRAPTSSGGSIEEPGDLAVFEVDVPSDSSVEVKVLPRQQVAPDATSTGTGTSDKAQLLDVEVELVDPDGVGRRIDQAGAGLAETVTVGSDAPPPLIVVRGYEASTGSFDITAELLERTTVTSGETATGQVSVADVPVEFSVDVPAGGENIVISPEPAFDPTVEVVDPGGTTRVIDSGGDGAPELVTVSGAGRHVVRVNGWQGSVGSFRLHTEVEARPLAAGSTVSTPTPALFDVEVAGDELFALAAEANSDDASVAVNVVGPGGFAGTQFTASLPTSGATTAIVGGSPPGTYRVLVSSTDASSAVTTSLTAIDVQELAAGETVSAPAPAAFDVAVSGDGPLAFTAEPEADGLVDVQVSSPDGLSADTIVSSPAAGDPATALVGGSTPGTYRVLVTPSRPQAVVTATLATVDVTEMVAGESTEAIVPGVFDVEIEEDQLLAFSADPTTDVDFLTIRVIGPGGDPSDTVATSPTPGGAATAIVGGGSAGHYQVIVNSSGSRAEVDATLTPIDVAHLAEGEVVTAVAPAGFEVDVRSDEFVAFTAQPDATDGVVAIDVVDPEGVPIVSSVRLPQRLPAELSEEVMALFPDEVAVLFRDGLPPTVAEAEAMLIEAGLLDEVAEAISTSPQARHEIFGAPSESPPGPASVIVGGGTGGTYRVFVSSPDPGGAVTARFDSIDVRPIAAGERQTATTPAVFAVDVAQEGSLVFTAEPRAEAVVELEVVDAEGDIIGWSSRAVPAGGSSTVRLPRADAGGYYVFVNASVPQTFFTATLGADD